MDLDVAKSGDVPATQIFGAHAMSSNSTILGLLMAAVGMFVFSDAAGADSILYVDHDAPGPVHDGSSWCQAFLDLQEALAAAEGSGGEITEIRVADGTYTPAGPNGDREATFQLLNGLALLGGFAGCAIRSSGLGDDIRADATGSRSRHTHSATLAVDGREGRPLNAALISTAITSPIRIHASCTSGLASPNV